MSAYVCNPEHIGVLAAFATTTKSPIRAWVKDGLIQTAKSVAKGLARENIRSVAHRYPNDKDGNRPGPCLLDAEIVEAAAIYAAHFVVYPQGLSPVQVLKLVSGLEYQSCETDDWKYTDACLQLTWIRDAAIRRLSGYDAAEWSFDQPLPEVDALYEKGGA